MTRPAVPTPQEDRVVTTPPARRRQQLRPIALAVSFVVAGTAVQLLRQPRVPTWNSLWQEDGNIFLSGALNAPRASLTATYNGYLHVTPRLIALVASRFPLDWMPLLFSGATALLAALVALYAYVVGRSIYQTRWAPAALAVLFVTLPAAAFEANADLANLHWFLLFGAFWALMDRPPNAARGRVGFVVALSAALCDTMAGLLAPLALLRAVRGGRRDRAAPLGLALGLLVQLLFTSSRPKPYTTVDPGQLPATYGLRVVGSLLFGDRYLLRIRDWGGDNFCLLLLVAALAGMVLAVVLMHRARRSDALLLAVSASLLSLAYLGVPLLLRGTYMLHGHTLNGARYEVLPVMLLATALLLLVDRRGRAPLVWPSAHVLVGAVGLTVILVNLPTAAVRSGGPPWDRELAAARALCRGQATVAPSVVRFAPGTTTRVLVPVSPASSKKAPFAAKISCERFR